MVRSEFSKVGLYPNYIEHDAKCYGKDLDKITSKNAASWKDVLQQEYDLLFVLQIK